MKHKSMLLCLCAIVSFTTMVWADGVIKNGGFEELKPDGSFPTDWGIHYIWHGPCTAVNDLANAHSGSVAVRVNQKAPDAHKDFVTIGSSRSPSGPGIKYRMSAWAKGKGALSMTIYFSANGEYQSSDGTFPPEKPLQSEFFDVDSEEWTQYFFYFTVPDIQVSIGKDHTPNAPQTVEVLVNVKGDLYLDDVELIPADQIKDGAGEFKLDPERQTLLTIPSLTEPPLVDGKLDDETWKKAAVTTGFCAAGGGMLSPKQTVVYAGYDQENLYIAFSALQVSGGVNYGDSGELQGAPSDVEEFEVWLAPDGQNWYQLLVTPGNGYLSIKSDGSRGWASDVTYGTNCIESTMMFGGIMATDSKTWNGEIVIPFASIGMQSPEDGQELRINFCRDICTRNASIDRSSDDWTCWSRVAAGFRDIKNFGYFIFASNTPIAQWSEIGNPAQGELCVAGTADKDLDIQTRVRLPELKNKTMLSDEGKAGAEGAFTLKQDIRGGGANRTEAALDVSISDSTGKVLSANVMPFVLMPPFSVETQLYYSAKKMKVKADFSRLAHPGQCSITFTVQDANQKQVATEKIPVAEKDLNSETAFDINGWNAGTYELNVTFDDASGNTMISNSVPMVIPEKPAWMDGELWQDRSVPEPYIPMVQKGNDTSVVLRTYTWQNSGLPKRVVYKNHELFAAPAELVLAINGKTEKMQFEPLKTLETADDIVSYQIQGKSDSVECVGTLSVEFDGFARWNVEFKPRKDGVKVTELSLNFPINPKDALFLRGDGCTGSLIQDKYTETERPSKLVHIGNIVTSFGSWMYDASGWTWTDKYFNEIVIGSDRYAFSVMSEGNEYVRGNKYVSAIKETKATVLNLSLVSEPTALDKPLKYDYFFQTMPIRPEPKDPKRWHAALDPSSIFCIDYEGYLNTPEGQELLDNLYVGESYYDQAPQGFPTWARGEEASNAALAKFHQHGMKIVCNQWYAVIPEICDEYKQFGAEWRAYPEFYWETPTSMMRSACLNSAFADFHLANLERVFAETGMDGVYTDATPIYCNNGEHGCGWTDAKGERHADLNLLATRRFVKQMYRRLKADGRGKINYNHNGESPATAGFVDVRTDGEELIWEGLDHYKRITPDYFRSTYAQNEYGVPYTFHAVLHYSWRRAGEVVPIREIMMMTLPHRVYHTLAFDVEILPVWKIVDPWWTTSDFRPYWYDDCPVTTTMPTDVLSSVFIKQQEKKALVIFSNWSYEDKTAPWTIDTAKLGFKVKSIVEHDTITGETRQIDINKPTMTLKSRDFAIVELRGE